MSRTISGTTTNPVTLSSTSDNPVTVISSAHLTPTAAYAYALYGDGGSGQSWTITNAGLIDGGTAANGILLGSGGNYVGASVITNQAGGTIEGVYGIRMYNTVASSITNMAGGTIESTNDRAVYFDAAGTLTNSGVIIGGMLNNQQLGVLMENGGTVINNAGATISGYEGVILIGSGTLTNAGTIMAHATNDFGVEFGSGGSRLIVDPGAVFVGGVSGGNGVLELASAASAGTLTAAGFEGFTEIEFDSGSQWTLVGNAATNLSGAIVGFTGHNTIDLTGFVAVSGTYSSGMLTVTNALTQHETLHFSGSALVTADFGFQPDGTGGTDIVACYCAGTRIATPSGEVAVERLRIGDLVATHGGVAKPVKWIGRRRYTAAQVAAAAQLCPVVIRKDALAAGTPHRDLLVSPMHSLFIDEVFIPAAALINGVSVRRRDAVAPVDYIHVELEEHEVIFAEGAAAETFVDDNSRATFDNADEYVDLYGADAVPCGFCAPRVEAGFQLEAVRRRLAERAGLPVATVAPGKLLGHVERFDNGVLQGWVIDDVNRTVPVELEVLVDGESVIRLVANGYRTDLDRAGLAGGRCAFAVTLPISARDLGQVRARRVSDGMALPMASP